MQIIQVFDHVHVYVHVSEGQWWSWLSLYTNHPPYFRDRVSHWPEILHIGSDSWTLRPRYLISLQHAPTKELSLAWAWLWQALSFFPIHFTFQNKQQKKTTTKPLDYIPKVSHQSLFPYLATSSSWGWQPRSHNKNPFLVHLINMSS